MAKPSPGIVEVVDKLLKPNMPAVPEYGAIINALKRGVSASELRPANLMACLVWLFIWITGRRLPVLMDLGSMPKIKIEHGDVFGRNAQVIIRLEGISAYWGNAAFWVYPSSFAGLGQRSVELPWAPVYRSAPVSPLVARNFDGVSGWNSPPEEVALTPDEAAAEAAYVHRLTLGTAS